MGYTLSTRRPQVAPGEGQRERRRARVRPQAPHSAAIYNQANRGRAEPRVGFLVANPNQQKRVLVWVGQWSTWQHEAFAQWNRTWIFAQELQERFGVKHTLLGPPHLATLPEEQATRLNSNPTYFPFSFFRWDSDNHETRRNVTYPPPYPPGKEVTVQAVRACTWPSCMVVGCASQKLPSFQKGPRLEGFIAHARHEAVRSSTHLKYKLVQGFKQNFALVAAAVKAHPCLKLDFQVFIRSDGGVFGIDLDRCFNDPNYKRSKTARTVDDDRSSVIALSNEIELPEPSRREWSSGGQPGTFCRRGSEQRSLDKALEHLYRRLSQQTFSTPLGRNILTSYGSTNASAKDSSKAAGKKGAG